MNVRGCVLYCKRFSVCGHCQTLLPLFDTTYTFCEYGHYEHAYDVHNELYSFESWCAHVYVVVFTLVHSFTDGCASRFNYSWDPAGTGGSPTPTPPLPGPHPAPSPCTTDLTGTWWGSHNNTYTMTVSSEGDVVLHAPPGCCAWSNATGTFSGITIHVVAHGKNNFQLDNVGTVSEDRCAIDWSKRWAPWRKQLSSL